MVKLATRRCGGADRMSNAERIISFFMKVAWPHTKA